MVNKRPIDSNQLVERARSGDVQALADLLGLYRNYLLLLARVHIDTNLQAKADPSDLVQETCLMAARDFSQFRGQTEAEFIGWLRQILANSGAAMIRRYKGSRSRDVNRELQNGRTRWEVDLATVNTRQPITRIGCRCSPLARRWRQVCQSNGSLSILTIGAPIQSLRAANRVGFYQAMVRSIG